MKKSILIFSVIFSFSHFLYSQNENSDNVAINDAVKPELKVEVNSEMNFFELYDINKDTEKKAKALTDIEIMLEPSVTSEVSGITIPKGAILDTYKYFPREACWAVHYNNSWGFVPTTTIMPIQVIIPKNDYSLYDEPPVLLSKINLIYPKDAKENNIEGKVFLKLLISKTGTVKSVEVLKGIPELNQAAINAVKKLKMKPAKYQGKPVNAVVRIPISFKLGG